MDGTNGFTILGGIGDYIGRSVGGGGDINGDGINDIIIGAQQASEGEGKVFVIYGQPSYHALLNLTTTANYGFEIDGYSTDFVFGRSVSVLKDINNDGIDEVIVGFPKINDAAGKIAVLYGSDFGFPSKPDWQSLGSGSVNGFILSSSADGTGRSVNSVGDVNGDGYNDFIVGAYGYNNFQGKVYVVYGYSGYYLPQQFELDNLNGTNGFVINGLNQGSNFGYAVSGNGDINKDGFADIVIGAFGEKDNSGSVYIIFGGNSQPPAQPAPTSCPPSEIPEKVDISSGVFGALGAAFVLGTVTLRCLLKHSTGSNTAATALTAATILATRANGEHNTFFEERDECSENKVDSVDLVSNSSLFDFFSDWF